MTTVVDGITFRIEGRDALPTCCTDGRPDRSSLQGSVRQTQRWIDVLGAYAGDHANEFAFLVLSVSVAVLFAIKRMRRRSHRAPEAMRRSPALLSSAYFDQPEEEEAARIAFLKRYGGPAHISLKPGSECR